MGTCSFLSCLLLFAVVLHWAVMMPSHSMDLPVPRGTSILILDGKVQRIVGESKTKINKRTLIRRRTVQTFVSRVVSMFQWDALVSSATVSPPWPPAQVWIAPSLRAIAWNRVLCLPTRIQKKHNAALGLRSAKSVWFAPVWLTAQRSHFQFGVWYSKSICRETRFLRLGVLKTCWMSIEISGKFALISSLPNLRKTIPKAASGKFQYESGDFPRKWSQKQKTWFSGPELPKIDTCLIHLHGFRFPPFHD